jgi:hypothetical protein
VLRRPSRTHNAQVSQEVAAQRAGFGQERYEKQEFQGKVSVCVSVCVRACVRACAHMPLHTV